MLHLMKYLFFTVTTLLDNSSETKAAITITKQQPEQRANDHASYTSFALMHFPSNQRLSKPIMKIKFLIERSQDLQQACWSVLFFFLLTPCFASASFPNSHSQLSSCTDLSSWLISISSLKLGIFLS